MGLCLPPDGQAGRRQGLADDLLHGAGVVGIAGKDGGVGRPFAHLAQFRPGREIARDDDDQSVAFGRKGAFDRYRQPVTAVDTDRPAAAAESHCGPFGGQAFVVVGHILLVEGGGAEGVVGRSCDGAHDAVGAFTHQALVGAINQHRRDRVPGIVEEAVDLAAGKFHDGTLGVRGRAEAGITVCRGWISGRSRP